MTSIPSSRWERSQALRALAWRVWTARTRPTWRAGTLAGAGVAAGAFALLALGACSRPTPPDTEKRPEPQADAGRLHRPIQAPPERARNVETDLEQAAEARRAAIEAAGAEMASRGGRRGAGPGGP